MVLCNTCSERKYKIGTRRRNGGLGEDFPERVMPDYGLERSMAMQQIDKGQMFGLKTER